jgi:hypothetical protein
MYVTKMMLRRVFMVSVLACALQQTKAADTRVDDVLTQWEPKPMAVADYQSFGACTPPDGPAAVQAISFSTSQEFPHLWQYYAEKCGINRRFVEGNTSVLSGTNSLGSYFLLERSTSLKSRESLFGLRTKSYSVFVTLRNSNGIESRPTSGTVVVSLR